MWQNSKTQNVTQINNLKCEEKTQNVTRLKKSKCKKKIKMWQNSITQIVKNSKTQIVKKIKNNWLWQNLK